MCEYLTDKDKEYEAVIHLGIVTDTLDLCGNILQKKESNVSVDMLKEVTEGFLGEQYQVPPMYSAIKVNGKKLYELARKGKEVVRKPRKINIKELEILSFDEKKQQARIRTVVSKGTYIRSLCDDIGKKLGCGACMGELIRTSSGIFNIREALTLDEIERRLKCNEDIHILHIEDTFNMPCMCSIPKYDRLIANGNAVRPDMLRAYDRHEERKAYIITGPDDVCIYMSDGKFAAVYRYNSQGKIYKPLKMFL